MFVGPRSSDLVRKNRRRRRTGAPVAGAIALGTSFALLAALLVTAAPAAAQVPPTITVSPSTGLTDGDTVSITGEGFEPGQVIASVQCAPGPFDLNRCTLGWIQGHPNADAQGTFSSSLDVGRSFTFRVDGVPTLLDCAFVTCQVLVGTPELPVLAPLEFTNPAAEQPELSVAEMYQASGTVTATFVGGGLPPEQPVRIEICAGTGAAADCETGVGFDARPDRTGHLEHGRVQFPRDLSSSSGSHDCSLAPGCSARVIYWGEVVASVDFIVPEEPGPPDPVITVDPATGLADADLVTVSGTGFSPGQIVAATMCDPLATGSDDCDAGTSVISATADSQGAFSFPYAVRRHVIGLDGTIVDCATAACLLRVGDHLLSAAVPVAFSPAPALPPPGLAVNEVADGEYGSASAAFTAEGLPPDREVWLRLCVDDETECPSEVMFSQRSSAAGTLDVADVRFPRLVTRAGTRYDCAEAPGCRFEVVTGGATLASAPAVFSPTELTVSVDLIGVVGGPDEAVASARISCNRAVPLAVSGTLRQGAVSGGFAFTSLPRIDTWCLPSSSLQAFVPARAITGGQFEAGSATLELSARVDAVGGTEVAANGGVGLQDHSAVVAALLEAASGPDGQTVAHDLMRAIAIRIWQDPVFAANWWSMLRGQV